MGYPVACKILFDQFDHANYIKISSCSFMFIIHFPHVPIMKFMPPKGHGPAIFTKLLGYLQDLPVD